MTPIDLSQVLKDLQGKWVALSNDDKKPSVYGVGTTAKDAARDAESKGNSSFYLLFVRSNNLFYTG